MYWHSIVLAARLDVMTIILSILGVLAIAGITAAFVAMARDGYRSLPTRRD